jgi:glutathione peroxidase-family protein
VKELPNRDDIEYSQMKITDVTGNFEKFLIDKRGRPRYRFHPTAWLGGKVIRKYIDQLLAES